MTFKTKPMTLVDGVYYQRTIFPMVDYFGQFTIVTLAVTAARTRLIGTIFAHTLLSEIVLQDETLETYKLQYPCSSLPSFLSHQIPACPFQKSPALRFFLPD